METSAKYRRSKQADKENLGKCRSKPNFIRARILDTPFDSEWDIWTLSNKVQWNSRPRKASELGGVREEWWHASVCEEWIYCAIADICTDKILGYVPLDLGKNNTNLAVSLAFGIEPLQLLDVAIDKLEWDEATTIGVNRPIYGVTTRQLRWWVQMSIETHSLIM